METSHTPGINDLVFINCPFDDQYTENLRAILYTIIRCGFYPKCSLEDQDGSSNRLEKIIKLIKGSMYCIHDLSRIEINEAGFPRFNMPFELGLFIGIKSVLKKKQKALILEKTQYEYQKFISDLNGIDTVAHDNNPSKLIKIVRDWLESCSKRKNIPTSRKIISEFKHLQEVHIPYLIENKEIDENIAFHNYLQIASTLADLYTNQ